MYTLTPTEKVEQASDELKKVLSLQAVVTSNRDQNSEGILVSQYGFNYQGYVMPKLTSAAAGQGNQYPGNFSVPIATTELFYTKNGVPIEEDKDWDYANRNAVQLGDNANKSYVKEGYETAKVNLNREPRYYADLGFDGGIWFGNNKAREDQAYYVQARGPEATAGPKSRLAA